MSILITKESQKQIDQLITATSSMIDEAKAFYIQSLFSQVWDIERPQLNGNYDKFIYTAKGLETVGLDLFQRYSRDSEIQKQAWNDLIKSAFHLRRSAFINTPDDVENLLDEVIDGLLANRQPELRLALKDVFLEDSRINDSSLEWDIVLKMEIIRAFLLLVRKNDGYNDFNIAQRIIDNLRAQQTEREEKYLIIDGRLETDYEAQIKASKLIALYNLAYVIELTKNYLSGNNINKLSSQGIKDEIDRFVFNAKEILPNDPYLRLFAKKIGEGCKQLINASIFSAVVPKKTREFLEKLAHKEKRPVLELWYAQWEALQKSLLDPTRLAVVISMPTSSGKTLLAEMAIIQAYNDDRDSKIVYLAPTRALVTQVSLTLRRDLAGQGPKIRIATPTFELDPIENEILLGDFNILVTTPEKLDLLIRLDHPSVHNLSLVVVDEAHNMNDPERGARLELLLATIRREKVNTRFLLLTPFANNAAELAHWLGGQQSAPIIVDWKPNDRVVGAIKVIKDKKKAETELRFISLKSLHSDCPEGAEIYLGNLSEEYKLTQQDISIDSVLKWTKVKDGSILLLAASRPKAEERAYAIAEKLPEYSSKSVDLICRFLNAEVGGQHPLSNLLKKRVAFHHAGLSPEARYFVERLVEEGAIDIICATTTLAQGVHFPLSIAIIENHYKFIQSKGKIFREPLKPWEFWNIAGRVGRTLEDSLGIIQFSTTNKDQIDKIQEFLDQDNSQISSTLWEALKFFKEKQNIYFSSNTIDRFKALSAFLQYIVHALSVSGKDSIRSELEGVLRASFIYQEAKNVDPQLADDLIKMARLYVDELAVLYDLRPINAITVN